MLIIFSPQSPYKQWARVIASIWTLLIFVGCLMPSKNIPEVDVPMIDKWVHFVMFGGFTFLWLCSRPVLKISWLFILFLLAVVLGTLMELLQGVIPSIHRSCDFWDGVADSIGGLLGIVLFWLGSVIGRK